MTTRIAIAVLAALLLQATPLAAESVRNGALEIYEPFARATPSQAQVGSAYLTIRNYGGEDDYLDQVSSSIALRADLRHGPLTDDIARSLPINGGLRLPAGATVSMRPGGDHIMLFQLKMPLKRGSSIDLELNFRIAGLIRIRVPVLSIGARSARD